MKISMDEIVLENDRILRSPPEFEWLPIGLYNGVDIPDTQIGGFYSGFNDSAGLIIEEDYIVWVKVPNPEYDCEVIME